MIRLSTEKLLLQHLLVGNILMTVGLIRPVLVKICSTAAVCHTSHNIFSLGIPAKEIYVRTAATVRTSVYIEISGTHKLLFSDR